MLTTAFVVALRPLQLLVACGTLVLGSLDQYYVDSHERLWILLGLILPATLLTISVVVHSTFAYANRHRLQGFAVTLRWLLDLLALLLISAAVPALLLTQNNVHYHHSPPAPFLTIMVITLCVNMALFLATTLVLAVEDYAYRTQDRVPDHRHFIVHTTYNEAILGPRPAVAPKEIAHVDVRPVTQAFDPYVRDWDI